MKFTNVKQLIIKFMGGGLINFPTRFLRWVKINGDTDDSDDGSGGDGDISFAQALTKAFRLDRDLVESNYQWFYSNEIPLPDLVMILGGDFYIVQNTFNRDDKISDISITLPEDLQYDEDLYKYVDGIPLDKCKIVPFNDIKEEDIYYSQPEDDYNSPRPSSLYFLYKIDKLSDTFHGTKRSINYLGSPGSTQLSIADYVFFIEYNGEYYFLSAYSGD